MKKCNENPPPFKGKGMSNGKPLFHLLAQKRICHLLLRQFHGTDVTRMGLIRTVEPEIRTDG